MRIAAIGDVHCRKTSRGRVLRLLHGVEEAADLLVLAGDLTTVGHPDEMEVLLEDLRQIHLPMVAVVGNHDHESDRIYDLIRMLEAEDIQVLDGNSTVIDGVGFIGTKGFCGGFGKLAVQPFGERTLKGFINATIEEAEMLQRALADVDSTRRVAVLHYSPIKETLEGEAPELYPFLGSSLMAKALDRYSVDVIFHGHAHNGSPYGVTHGGIPVYNVSHHVLMRHQKRSYVVVEV